MECFLLMKKDMQFLFVERSFAVKLLLNMLSMMIQGKSELDKLFLVLKYQINIHRTENENEIMNRKRDRSKNERKREIK